MRHRHGARAVAALAGFVLLAACDKGPADEASPLDPTAYSGDRVCELPAKDLLAEAGMTEPGEPGRFMGGSDGCEWSEDGLLQLSLNTRQSLKTANVRTDTKYRSSESGTIAGYPSVTNWFQRGDSCNVYVGLSPTAHLEIHVSGFDSGKEQCALGEKLLASAVERVKSG